jgi:hypothetical protein
MKEWDARIIVAVLKCISLSIADLRKGNQHTRRNKFIKHTKDMKLF